MTYLVQQMEETKLRKLSEESLAQQPEEVFDIICKLGEGSYGSVHKALHKESGQLVAIKQIPVDADLQEIIKEISMMQQCDSPYIVKYYGSYFKNSDLWIVMEYCGAGSVSDIMRLRKKTLTEDEIATILNDILKGLEYLHSERKIHRDIKAGNILLNLEGHAKLADFGVAGQLTATLAKRNTVIGSPYWMAPEVIQEIGYDCSADIWSLGITALEMTEGKPPYADIHPMRAIFMIPTRPPPSLREPDKWSSEFIDFIGVCLVKNPEERGTVSDLINHVFISNAKTPAILNQMLADIQTIRESKSCSNSPAAHLDRVKPNSNNDRAKNLEFAKDESTLVPSRDDRFLPMTQSGTLVDLQPILHHDANEEPAYIASRPQHFQSNAAVDENKDINVRPFLLEPSLVANPGEFQNYNHGQVNQLSPTQTEQFSYNNPDGQMDFIEYIKILSYEELQQHMPLLDIEMEKEIDELFRRYQVKRRPILDAINVKRKRQQNF